MAYPCADSFLSRGASMVTAALLIVLGAATALAAPPALVEAKLTQSTLRVGDQVALRVSVTHPRQAQVEFPDLQGKLGFVEAVRFQLLAPTLSLDGTQVTTGEYIVTSFVPGRFTIPPVAVGYTDPDGVKSTVASAGPLTLDVSSVLTNTNQDTLRDIKPPMAIARDAFSYLSTGALAALSVSGAALAALAVRRLRRRAPGAARHSGDSTPEAIAHQELDRIAELDLLNQGRYGEYCALISMCVRLYLDARHPLETSASTTTEIRTNLRGTLNPWQTRVVIGLLEECDAVRWAGYQPNPQRADRLLSIAHEIVDLTGTSPEEPDPFEVGGRRSGEV